MSLRKECYDLLLKYKCLMDWQVLQSCWDGGSTELLCVHVGLASQKQSVAVIISSVCHPWGSSASQNLPPPGVMLFFLPSCHAGTTGSGSQTARTASYGGTAILPGSGRPREWYSAMHVDSYQCLLYQLPVNQRLALPVPRSLILQVAFGVRNNSALREDGCGG